MKTYKHLFLSLAAITAFFCSCATNSSPEPETKSWKKIQLTTSIQEASSKTALSSARTSGLDNTGELARYGFGFFATYETEEPQKAAGWYKNEKIVRSGENWACASGEEMQWKSANQAYSVYAYAPYLTEENAYLSLDGDDIRIAVPASQNNEQIQEKLDLLHWKRQEPFKPGDLSNGVLPINFQRQMAKVQIRVNAGDNLTASKDLTAETFRVKNIASTARFNLRTGALALDESAEKIAEASGKFSAASSSASYELLVLPQSTSGVSLELRLDGQVYPVKLSELRLNGQSFAALEKGKHYAFEITLHRDRGNLPTKLSVGNVNIQNWEHNSLELGEVGKPAPAGENNLFEAIRNATAKDVGGTPLYTVNIGTNFDMEAAFEHPEDVSELFKQTCKGKKNKDIIGNMDVLVKLNKNINLEQSIKIKLLMDNFTGPLPNKLFKNSGQNTWLAEFSANKASSIGDSAFEQCIILNSVHLKSATQCGNKSFYYNSDLTSVFLPLVKKIGNNAFETCYNLSTVDFPSATSLGDMALRFTEINNPNLPKTLSIGNEAFSYCKNLTRLNLPLAEKIGRIPFIGSGLKTLKLGTTNIITTDLLTKTDHEDAIEPSSIVLYLNGKEYQQANKENSEWKGMKWLAILPYETEK